MIGCSLFFSCLKKKGLAYGDFEGWIRPEASCSSTQRFISPISSRVKEYSLEERCSATFTSSSIPNWILPSLFCDPSTLYIVIGFSKGDGSRPTLFAHSKSMKQLVHP